MKIWLLVLSTLIVGCAGVDVREPSTFFADYTVERDDIQVQAVELPPGEAFDDHAATATTIDGEPVVVLSEAHFTLIAELIEGGKANTKALKALSEAFYYKEREVYFLVMAGRRVEHEASLYRQMYLNEAQQCRLYQFGAVGLGGLSLILTGMAF